MFKHLLLYALILLFLTHVAVSQTDQKNDFGISFHGFVKTDMMFDSRQNVTIREGHFLLYPAAELPDMNDEDVNASANLNMLSIQTRLTGHITGPEAFGAKTSGVLEGAFFGHSDGDINGFRLRHAFVKLSWESSSLLIGQYWHPMFITEVFPDVISFNTGVPFQPFSRNPQIRFVQNFDKLMLTLTAASQRDFASMGPNGGGSQYLRNALTPIMNANLKYVSPEFVAGAGANYLSLRPELVTSQGFKTDEQISSITFMGFAKFTSGDFQCKLEAVKAQNASDVTMLGGYAVKSMNDETGIREYTNINTLSLWGELIYGADLQVALFGGYTKNEGADDEITGAYYSRGSNIANVMRIAPRVQYTMGKVRFAAEIEHTIAEYGTPNEKGVVEETTNSAGEIVNPITAVANTRVLLSAYLFF